MAPPAVAWWVLLLSDCSVGKYEVQVGKMGSQVGKYGGQVGKIAVQVGIAISGNLIEGCTKQKRLLARAKSSNKILKKGAVLSSVAFFYIFGDDSLVSQKDWESV